MSLCINPQCPQPDHPDNGLNRTCQACGSDLLLQGRYRVMRLISSQSGFGKVYEAYERNIPKILKVLKESHNQNSKVLELFQREATVLSRLNHPGVPQVGPDGYFSYCPRNGDQVSTQPLHCIVMEKIDGPNLKQWMVQQGNHTIGEQQALLWLAQLADVLHLVHQQNYFHRDIKPENIMLRSSGQLVLVDFGAAREMTETYLAHLGASGITTVSSAGYTPPEQEQGQAVPQSDFYALGRTIIYLLTAKTPSDPTIYDSFTNAFNWRAYAPQVSPSFAQLIDDLIAPRAIDRPQTTQEILQRLAAVRNAQPHALRSRDVEPLPEAAHWPTTTLEPPQALLTQQQNQTVVRKPLPWRWILPGLAALGLLVGTPALWWAGARLRDPSAPAAAQRVPTKTVTLVRKLDHDGPIRAILLGEGQTLISGGEDRQIRIWNLGQAAQPKVLRGHTGGVNTLALSPDQQTLYSAGADQSIRFWDVTSGAEKKTLPAAHDSPINMLALSPNGKILASADSEGVVKLWNAETGDSLGPLESQDSLVNRLVFARNGKFLVGAGQALQLWDLQTRAVKRLFESPGFIDAIAISGDNQVLISAGNDKTTRFWDAKTGAQLDVAVGHTQTINDLVFSANSLTFASASADGTVGIWDMNSRKMVGRLEGFDSDIYRYLEGPAGQIITTGGTDNTVKIWQVEAP